MLFLMGPNIGIGLANPLFLELMFAIWDCDEAGVEGLLRVNRMPL
jgi:hypothetical protein